MASDSVADEPSAGRGVSRRALFVTGGAALAIGAVGTEVANLAMGQSSGPLPQTTPPDVDLMGEHGVLKRVLLIYQECLDRISRGQPAPLSAVNGAAGVIHDFIESFHEALEEGYIFPPLEKAGRLVETVNTLYVQHARGRELTQLILTTSSEEKSADSNTAALANAMAAFVRMYGPHEAREDTVVYPLFRALHSPAELEQLGNTFADLREKMFGPHGFAHVVAHVATIEKSLGIYDLNQFTPEPPS